MPSPSLHAGSSLFDYSTYCTFMEPGLRGDLLKRQTLMPQSDDLNVPGFASRSQLGQAITGL
jgi:hypothetical protein